MTDLVRDHDSGEMVSRKEFHLRIAARAAQRARQLESSGKPEAQPTKVPEPVAPPPRDPEPKTAQQYIESRLAMRRTMGIAEMEAMARRSEMNAIDAERIKTTPHTTDEAAVRAREEQENPRRVPQPVFNER